jgi:hypothetical protein
MWANSKQVHNIFKEEKNDAMVRITLSTQKFKVLFILFFQFFLFL